MKALFSTPTTPPLTSLARRAATALSAAGLLGALLLGSSSAAQAQPTAFSCTAGKSYLFQGNATDVYEFDIASGNTTQKTFGNLLASPNQLNAVGYNSQDNFMYAQRNGQAQIVRIGSNFPAQGVNTYPSTTAINVAGLGSTDDLYNAVVGDISPQGVMYLTRGGSPGARISGGKTTVYKIDLAPLQASPAGALSAVALPVKSDTTYINDWAVSPVDGNLYAIYSYISTAGNKPSLTLYRYTTTGSAAGTRTVLGKITAGPPVDASKADHPIGASNFGSAFMDASGNFFVVANETGYIYRISTPHTGNLKANYVAMAPAGATNTDGARCPASAVSTSGPLPVQLTSFAATPAPGRSVQLAWATATELNSAYFEVQHSLDGQVFAALGRVAAQGNAAQPSTYAYTATTVGSAATHYYRLRQVDLDGSSTFSAVRGVTLAAGHSAAQLSAYPNPASARELRAQVQYDGPAAAEATLTLRDMLGRPVLTQAVTLQPGANVLAPSAALAPGSYWLSLGGEAVAGTPGVRMQVAQ